MSQNIEEITKEEYKEKVVNEKGLVILDFYSDECSPCEALAPKFEDMASVFGDKIKFYKIFRQQNRDLSNELKVSSSPTLIFYKEGKEILSRLTGGIKKKELIDRIQEMVPQKTFEDTMNSREKKVKSCDVLILGGGPAGMSAAIYAAQAKQKTILVDTAIPGGQVKTTHMISNFPGTGKAVNGWELSEKMLTQVKESGAETISAVDVTSLEFSNTGGIHKVVIDNEIIIHAKTVILAMGAEPRLINIPGEIELKGQGISYCATCDGKYYDDREVVVIGGGNSAVEESLFLTRFASKVTIVHQFDTLNANKTAQEHAIQNKKINFMLSHEPRKFEKFGDKLKITLQNMKTKELSEIITDGIFIFIGMKPNTEMLTQVTKDNWGYIPTNEDMETNLRGVYAVGDIRVKKIRQAATAVGDGCIAAVISERYLTANPQLVSEDAK